MAWGCSRRPSPSTSSHSSTATACTPQARQVLSEKIGRLKKEIQEQQASDAKGLSPEDISIFRKTMSGQKDIPTLLDGAAALKELGLMEEAVAEYEKLLALDHVGLRLLQGRLLTRQDHRSTTSPACWRSGRRTRW